MERKLTPEEHIELEGRHRRERDGRVRDRIKAVLLYDKGYSYPKIAEILLLDDDTVRRHIKGYFEHFKLKPENGGSKSHLNAVQTDELLNHLREVTYLYVKDICLYVELTYKKQYTVSGMTKWLHAHKFRYKKPHGVPAKADNAAQEAFISEYQALKDALTEKDILYFADSTHPQHQTRLSYGWIERGVRKAMKMTACQKRVNIIGAMNVQTHTLEYAHVNWVNFDSISAFLTQLITLNPDKHIHLIWDNAGYHKSKKLHEFIKELPITLHYLPAYSPNLNPIERLWKIMHEKVTYNRYYPKLADFRQSILDFFNNIAQYKTLIQQRINDNFQRLQLT